jgi:uncharacterized protein (TIGR00369 family)
VHGGLLATLLDEIMVWACAVRTKKFAFCAEMTVRFLNPLRPGQEVFVAGELVQDKRRLFEAKAEIEDAAGVVYAVATGKYVPNKDADLTEMATDFVGGQTWPQF